MPRIRCPSLCLVYFTHMWARNWSYELHKTIHHGTQFSPLAVTPAQAKGFHFLFSLSPGIQSTADHNLFTLGERMRVKCMKTSYYLKQTHMRKRVTDKSHSVVLAGSRKEVMFQIWLTGKKSVWSIKKIFIGFVSCLKNNWQTSFSRHCSGQNWGNKWYFTSFHIRTLCN